MTTPIGIRLNNPANIRYDLNTVWLGSAGFEHGFVAFTDMKWGVRAAAKLLRNYMNKHGLKTVAGIIYRWAPPSGNNPTEQYVANVCNWSGFSRDEILHDDKPTIRSLLHAMIRQEQGLSIESKVLEEGVDLAYS